MVLAHSKKSKSLPIIVGARAWPDEQEDEGVDEADEDAE